MSRGVNRLAVLLLAVVVIGGTGWGWSTFQSGVNEAVDTRSSGSRPLSPLPAPTATPTEEPSVTREVAFAGSEGDFYDAERMPTGQRWLRDFNPPAQPEALVVEDGGLRLDSAGAAYLWTRGFEDVQSAAVTFSFDRGDTANAAVALVTSRSESESAFAAEDAVFTNSVHTVVTPERVLVGGYRDGALTYLGEVPVDLRFGKKYTLTVARVTPDSVRVTVDDVTRTLRGDGLVEELWGPVVGIEHFQPDDTFSTDARPVIWGHEVRALD